MYYETLRDGGRPSKEDRLVLFIAGDYADAKAVVSKLIEDIGFSLLIQVRLEKVVVNNNQAHQSIIIL